LLAGPGVLHRHTILPRLITTTLGYHSL